MDVTQPEWGLLHAGAMMLVESGTSMQGLTPQQISDVGAMVFALLEQGAAPTEYAEFFRLPALIHHALTTKDGDLEDINEEQMQQIYERYIAKVEKWLKEKNPVHRYAELAKQWRTRPQLARQILKERNIDEAALGLYLSTHFAHKRTNAQGVPSPVPNIDEVFADQNKALADAYRQVDELVMTDVLLNNVAPAEQSFLAQSDVKLIKVQVVERPKEARNPSNPFKSYQRPELQIPDDVDIWRAAGPSKEVRYYTLRPLPGGEHEWRRSDTLISEYVRLVGDSALPREGMDYFIEFKHKDAPQIKKRGAPLLDMARPLADAHASRMLAALKEKGYEPTPAEQVGEFLLNFIPFYECVTQATEGNVQEALVSCAIDLASLVPFLGHAGRAAKVTAQGLTQAARSALRVGATQATIGQAVKGAAKQFARQFPLVGAQEAADIWKGVGRSFFRGLDPGFEHLLWGGKKAVDSVRAFTKIMKEESPAIARLDVSLTLAAPKASASKMPDTVPMYYAGSGPGFGKYLDVMPSGKMNGRQTYVQVNPDTGKPFGPRYIRNGVGNLDLAPVSIGSRLHLLQPQSRVIKAANAGRSTGPAATPNEGFTDATGTLLYGEAFSAVAKQYNVVISVRAPNPLGETLLKEGFPSKNFHMKGKSSPTGPTAGFIAQNPRYSKVKPAAHEKQAKEIAAAQAKGSQAVPLVLTKERTDELVRTGNMRDLGDGRYSADYPSGTEEFTIDASGAVKDAAGQPVMVMTNPPEKGKYPVVEENKLGKPRLPPEQRTRPGRIPEPADTTRPITADYDLFSMIFSENRSNNARPYIVAPRLIRGQFELRPLKSRPIGDAAEDPDMGNVSFATERVIGTLNKKIAEQGYTGGKLVWHGDETANPFSPGFDIADKPIYFLPSGEVYQVHSRAQLNDLHDLLRQRGYAPEISPRF